MSAARESKSHRGYLKLHAGENREFNPREGTRREASATRQASELERARVQALTRRRLPKRKLPAMMWMAHQLGAIVRKGGVTC